MWYLGPFEGCFFITCAIFLVPTIQCCRRPDVTFARTLLGSIAMEFGRSMGICERRKAFVVPTFQASEYEQASEPMEDGPLDEPSDETIQKLESEALDDMMQAFGKLQAEVDEAKGLSELEEIVMAAEALLELRNNLDPSVKKEQ